MNEKELMAAQELLEMLVDFYDDSALQPPIVVGDARHKAICNYRAALPNQHLPPGEAKLMRRLLELSRSEAIDKREESQGRAEDWAELLREKYPRLRTDEPTAGDGPPTEALKLKRAALSMMDEENAQRLLAVAADGKRTADQKMQEVLGIDGRYVGWHATRWAELLGVTDAAIRQTACWRKLQRSKHADH